MQQPSDSCQVHLCCPLPDLTVGTTVTTAPGTDAQVHLTPTPCGAQLDFLIPRGDQGPQGPEGPQGPQGPEGPAGPAGTDVYASFSTFMARFPSGEPIAFRTEVPDSTSQIVQTSGTQVTLQPGVYLVSYHISAILETAGYLQITPAYNGRGYLEYGVYGRTAQDRVSVSGSASLIALVQDETTLTLRADSDVQTRDGAMTMTILGLRPPL